MFSKLFSDRANSQIIATLVQKPPTTADQATSMLQAFAKSTKKLSPSENEKAQKNVEEEKETPIELDARGRPKQFPVVERKREWFEKAKEKLLVIVNKICSSLSAHSSPQVCFVLDTLLYIQFFNFSIIYFHFIYCHFVFLFSNQVRLAVVRFCDRLLIDCPISLDKGLSTLIDVRR